MLTIISIVIMILKSEMFTCCSDKYGTGQYMQIMYEHYHIWHIYKYVLYTQWWISEHQGHISFLCSKCTGTTD